MSLDKACALVGRVPVCDLVLENDTISRQHAVFQQRANGVLYLFDMGSTHGTYIFKKRVEPKTYVELKAGMHVHFGMSARRYIVTGGPVVVDDAETDASSSASRSAIQVGEAAELQPALSKRKLRDLAENSFTGTAEDAEKFMKQKKHQEDRKKYLQKKKKPKKAKSELDDFENEDEDENDESDSDLMNEEANEGEAPDPEKLIVGSARSNWADFEDDDDGSFYTDAQKGDAKELEMKKRKERSRAQSRDELISARIAIDTQMHAIDEKLAIMRAELGVKGGKGDDEDDEEDALDAYMENMAATGLREEVGKMERHRETLETEKTRLDRLVATTETAMDRLAVPRETLATRVAASMDKGFAAPVPRVRALHEPSVKTKTDQGTVSVVSAAKNGIAATIEAAKSQEKKKPKIAKPEQKFVIQDPDYVNVEWTPPVGRSGDGKSDLNSKFGY